MGFWDLRFAGFGVLGITVEGLEFKGSHGQVREVFCSMRVLGCLRGIPIVNHHLHDNDDFLMCVGLGASIYLCKCWY